MAVRHDFGTRHVLLSSIAGNAAVLLPALAAAGVFLPSVDPHWFDPNPIKNRL